MNFVDAFVAAVAAEGLRATWGPTQFVDAWAFFVSEADTAYVGDLYEYEDELSVRDILEIALADSYLSKFPQWEVMREKIMEVDQRFRSVLDGGPEIHPGDQWWRSRLPRRAGAELAHDARRIFGVDVESV